ncbi:MAG: BamA/TamA family outer membrane protein [Rikenellaceae bacterium]
MKRHRGLRQLLFTLTICLICSSCGITRHIPEDQLLLQSIEIKQNRSTPKNELIPTSTLARYTRQSPNKRLLGTNFYIWVYYQANPDKSNWWNTLKRKIGQEPVYLDPELTAKSLENLNIYMDSQGFYSSTVGVSIDTLANRRRAKVLFNTHQGVPYIINSMKYRFLDTLLRPIILPDTTNSLIQKGDIFSVALLDEERERITSHLRSKGYFDFTVRNIEYLADTLAANYTVDLEMIIKRDLNGYDTQGKAQFKDNRRYRIANVNILPDFDPSIVITDSAYLTKIDTLSYRGLNIIHLSGEKPKMRPQVLRQMIPLTTGSLYNSKVVEESYQNLMSLGFFKSARINFGETSLERIERDTLLLKAIEEYSHRSQPKSESDSLSTDRYISSTILCTPALKQSYEIEIEGTTTSSFYGLNATLGYQNRNIFRGAEVWNVDFTVGYEHMKAPDAVKTRATEVGVSTGLAFPRFILPELKIFTGALQPKTTIDISANIQDRPYYNRTLSSASLSYSWRNRRYSNFTVRPIDINLIDMKYIDETYFNELENDYLKNSYESQLIAGMNIGYTFNNQRKSLRGNYTMLRINAESSGNLLSSFEHLLGKPTSDDNYEIFGIKYAQYIRCDINISRKYTLGLKSAIVGRLYAGAGWAYDNSTALPFDRLFYSGGSNSMRGWTPRTLGPGSSDEEIDAVYPTQLGDMKLEVNLEYRFPIWNGFHGATFLDLGNVWYLKDSEGVYDEDAIFNKNTFYKQLGFNSGFGLRLDIQFAILRLDWGVQLHNPNKDVDHRWVIKDWDWNNTALNFGVGYPF